MPEAFVADWAPLVVAAPFVGSFLGLLIARLPAGGRVLTGRSACPSCGHTLAIRDLVPVVSWLASRGRCRYCAAGIGAVYPAVEIAAVGVAAWAATELDGWLLWTGAALGWLLLALAVIDARHRILPDALTLPLIPCGLAVAYAVDPGALGGHAIGAAAGFACFAAIGWLYRRLRGREGLGLGDAKLVAGAGAWVAWQGLPSVVLLAGASALAVALIDWRRGSPLSSTTRVAFGPYLCLGAWLVWLYGPIVIGG